MVKKDITNLEIGVRKDLNINIQDRLVRCSKESSQGQKSTECACLHYF